jgi:hypothetical protein
MVDNVVEWVADWVPRSTACGTWSAGVSPTGDDQCLAGAATTGEPGALLRGGYFNNSTLAGPLTVDGSSGRPLPSAASASVAPASHIFVGNLTRCALAVRGWAGMLLPVRPRIANGTLGFYRVV